MADFLTVTNAAIAAVLAALALVASYRAVLTSRTPQGAIGWILLILLVPVLGTLLYLVFGHADYKSFERERRKSDEDMFDMASDQSVAHSASRLDTFARIARLPVTEGNDMSLLIDGHATYDAVLDGIRSARRTLFVQFYTIKDDDIGRALRDALIDRAEAGVSVWLLHDELPFFGLPRRFKQKLQQAGVRLARPQGPKRLLGPFQFNYRNHRKLVVVDNAAAYTGGLNVSKTYVGRNPSIGPWRDTFARVTGPVVAQLALHFSSDWMWATGEDLSDIASVAPDPCGPLRAVALAPSPAEDIAAGNLYFIALAHAARQRLWISTPYFVPDRDVLTALRFAALRGVDVKVLVPGRADHYITYFATMAYFDDLRSAGGEVWTYDPAFIHQKVALVDDDIASVGSINLDIRSGLLNFELTVLFEGASVAEAVGDMLTTDFGNATRVDIDLADRNIVTGILARVARLFAPVL
ncbi:MAG: cardiolipin synthase [Marivita sp.]|uniref:cardiolipin synthase n=1 Tax=Marivita sp. TaxID=2003365 RepID=UPI0025C60D29|nr:cardiolipin synthase [Marivita sp.]MCI5112613.1 cardiolipin synthase [Marivita sp.]